MIYLKTVINYTDFLDFIDDYKPNYNTGYTKLSDYKYLIAHQFKDHYQIFVGNNPFDDNFKNDNAIIHVLDINKKCLVINPNYAI